MTVLILLICKARRIVAGSQTLYRQYGFPRRVTNSFIY